MEITKELLEPEIHCIDLSFCKLTQRIYLFVVTRYDWDLCLQPQSFLSWLDIKSKYTSFLPDSELDCFNCYTISLNKDFNLRRNHKVSFASLFRKGAKQTKDSRKQNTMALRKLSSKLVHEKNLRKLESSGLFWNNHKPRNVNTLIKMRSIRQIGKKKPTPNGQESKRESELEKYFLFQNGFSLVHSLGFFFSWAIRCQNFFLILVGPNKEHNIMNYGWTLGLSKR
jgi:hypothetical protein